MALTPEQIRVQGYTILQDPSEIKDYKIVGQYGKSKTPGSFLYGTALPKTPVAPPTNQLTETLVSPTPVPPPAPITTGEAYKGYLPAENQEINKAEEDYLASLKSKIAPVDEASIRAEKLKQFQAEIDAVNQAAAQRRAEILRTEGLAGEQRLGQTTAIQARRGLLGSDFGASQSEMTRENTRQIIAGKTSLVDAERANAVAGILGQARGSADEEIKAKIAAREAGSKEYIDFLKGQAERKSQNAATTLSNYLTAGHEPTDAEYAEIAKLFGTSVGSLKSQYQSGKLSKEAEKAKATKENITTVDGVAYKINANGTLTPLTQKAPEKLTGAPMEYEYYKAEEIKAGRKPMSFNEYQNVDANRKRSIVNNIIGNSGMNTKQQAVFQHIVDKYNASPLIQASDRTPVLKDTISAVKSDPKNGTLQLNLAYSYIQALDTYQSAVREGELGLVNSIDSKIGQLKNSVEQISNGQTVRPEVALKIADAANLLVNTISSAAQNKAKSFESNAKVSGVGDAWNEYTQGFTANYNKPTTVKPQQMTLPNGVTVTLQADGTYK